MDGPKINKAPAQPPQVLPLQKTVIEGAEVTQAPVKSGTLEGQVVKSSLDGGETVIATPKGDVKIKTQVPLAEGTDIRVEIYQEKVKQLADIIVKRTVDDTIKQAITQIVRQPPIKTGDIIPVIFIPDDAAPLPESTGIVKPVPVFIPSEPVTLEKIAALIPQLIAAVDIKKLPFPPPLKPAQLQEVLLSPEPLKALNALPPPDQKNLLAYFNQPRIMNAIEAFLATTPQTFQPQTPPADNIAPPAPLPVENGIIEVLQAQMSAKIAQASLPTAPQGDKPAPLFPQALTAVIPFLQNLFGKPENAMATTPQMPEIMQKITDIGAHIPQNMHHFKITAMTPPDEKTPAAKPGEMTGIVKSFTPAGFPVVDAEGGMFVLKTEATVKEGTRISFTVQPMTAEEIISSLIRMPTGLPVESMPFDPLNDSEWPALQEALRTIMAATPDAGSAIRNSIPAPANPAKMTPTTLFFLAALRSGVIESWIGDKAMETLRQSGRRDLAEKLSGDFSRLSTQSKTPVGGEWRALSLPMMHDDTLSQMQFFVRQQPDHDDGEEAAEGKSKPITRFVVNMKLSRMGSIQLDGLVRKKQFDMVLRTADALPESMRRDLMQAFARGVEQAGMQGAISFQKRAENWVKIG